MSAIKTIATILILATLFSTATYMAKTRQRASMAAVTPSPDTETTPDRALCERLIRFGQVAYERGRYAEARHFFQKAIGVDPGLAAAWKHYNRALFAQISARVEADPGFLPEFSSGAVAPIAPTMISPDSDDDDDGC